MLVLGLYLILGAAQSGLTPADTSRATTRGVDTLPVSVAPTRPVVSPLGPGNVDSVTASVIGGSPALRVTGLRIAVQPTGTAADTIPKRRKAVEVSEWYGRRLTIHRYVAYATIPVFAAQWAAGEQLYDKSRDAPTWAKTTHRVGASALAGMFAVNTVTGVWNWWDSRSTPEGRVLRTMHALSILGADAAFTYAGVKLSDEAENSLEKRRQHRTVALSAMGVTAASGLIMKIWNR